MGFPDILMLTKCANPSCTESFRYLGKGRLFRLEADPVSRSYTSHPDTVQEEYFWMCSKCSEHYTLHLDDDGQVSIIALPEAVKGKARQFAIISRTDGMLLRSVASPRMRHK